MKKLLSIVLSILIIFPSSIALAVGGIVTNLFYEYIRKDSKGRICIKRSITVRREIGRY